MVAPPATLRDWAYCVAPYIRLHQQEYASWRSMGDKIVERCPAFGKYVEPGVSKSIWYESLNRYMRYYRSQEVLVE